MSEITPHDGRVTLRAGGIAPLGTKLPEDERASPVGAYAFTHPALAGRTVVRLSPEAVAAGTDAEMTALGFAKKSEGTDLGLVRYRTLGFPAWPLVHDPKKARFALEVTQDFRKAKKRAASKPGHAREAFEEIAKRLQRTVPHFLPSFWEEAGRVLADEGSASMGAQCFEKARDAERAHKLTIDADARDAVFLEFALLGALSAKTLSAYAKELERSKGAADAYRRFRSLAVKRALGGLPPWSGMGKDLRSLAKSAKLDADRQDDEVLRELLDTPAIARAPREFWMTFRAALVRVGKADGAARAQLSSLFPTPKNESADTRKKLVEDWMGLLDEIGALSDLPNEGLSEWLSKLIRWAGSAERVQSLLRELAPRITAPVSIIVKQRWWPHLDLDLAELCLSLGIPLVDPGDEDFEHKSISDLCDPVHVAADPRFAKKLVDVVENMMGDADAERKMAGKAGFTAARRAWLVGQIEELEGRGLFRAKIALTQLENMTSASTFAAFPDLNERLGRVSLESALGRVLRAGIFDELGWPAFEEAADAFDAKKFEREGAFPWLVLRDDRRAVVLGPNGIVLKHDFVSNAKSEEIEGAIFVDQQLFVRVRDKKEYETTAYWSGAPKVRFEPKGVGYGSFGFETKLPDGSVTLGHRSFRAGDTTLAWFGNYAFDGTTMFTHSYQGSDGVWREYDPIKGKAGRASRPTFFEEFVADGKKVETHRLSLHSVPMSTSPLGVKDGLTGLRIRHLEGPKRLVEAERIDGVKFAGDNVVVDGLLSVPSRAVPLLLEEENYGTFDHTASLRAPDGEVLADLSQDAWAARGYGRKLPPLLFWHYLTPRDPKGSAALAALGDASVAKLLQAALADLSEVDEDQVEDCPLPKTEAVAKSLGITNERLARGVAGIAAQAASLTNELAELVAKRSKDAAASGGAALGVHGEAIVQLDRALQARKVKVIEDFEVDLPAWLMHGRGKAMRSRAPFAEDSSEPREILQAIGATSFADDVANVRIIHVRDESDDEDEARWDAISVIISDASSFGIRTTEQWAIERSFDGVFRVPPQHKLMKEERPARAIGRVFVDAYLALGPVVATFEAAEIDVVAARSGLSRAEAGILLLGAPIDGYSRDYLGKERREALGLKVNEAEAVRGTFKDLEEGVVDRVFDEAASDPAALSGAAWAERLGDAWKKVVGEKVQLPEALVLAAQKDFDARGSITKLLSALAAPASSTLFNLGKWTTLGQANGWVSDPGEDGFDPELCKNLVHVLAWVVFVTPVGDPIRAGIPAFYERLRGAMSDPSLVWGLGTKYVDKKHEKKLHALLDLVKGKQVIPPKDSDDDDEAYVDGRDTGVVIVGKGATMLRAAFRPGRVTRWEDPELQGLANGLVDEDEDEDSRSAITIAKLVLSKELEALASRAVDSPLPAGSFEANPLLSAKKTVSAVEKANGISTDAAALYLQLLALAEPTEKAVLRWNDWKPKQYQAAVAELAKKKLVVQGKRERAQREVFLPGGFSKGVGKNLPMEEWKQQFYSSTLSRNLPLEPLHTLFARAWKLVEAGEGPRFEKVR